METNPLWDVIPLAIACTFESVPSYMTRFYYIPNDLFICLLTFPPFVYLLN